MRLLLDEQLDPTLAVELRSRGYDVVAVAEDLALRGRSDAELLDLAAAHGFVIATRNVRDFLRLLEEREQAALRITGIIAISRGQFPTGARGHGQLLRALAAILDERRAQARLVERVVWLAPVGSG